METLKQCILPYLETDFEKDLLEAALCNLNEADNKLRLNNFAYAARELTRHFLERLAPDKEVLKAPWFKVENQAKPNEPTRGQRIRYAVQGYLSDDFTKNELKIDLSDVSKSLRDSITDLSKYTHVNPDTFDADLNTITDISYNIMQDILRFFMTVMDAKYKVWNKVIACIDEEMMGQFYIETQPELDILASHYEVLNYMITEYKPLEQDEETITMQATGFVNVRLQYGSDGDMRRGDGYETVLKFPFTSTCVANYKNQQGDIHIETANVSIDDENFYE